MTLFTRFVVCLVILSIGPIGAFGGGFQLNEHGARSMAQAGAFAARAADGSAIFFNPAGLAFQKGTSFMAGTTLITVAGKFVNLGSVATELESQVFFPSNAYLTHTMDNGLAFGVGFFNPYGLGTKWPANWEGRRLAVETELKTYFINPTISYRLSDQFSFGVGVSYVLSDVSLTYRVPALASLVPLAPAADGTAKLTGDGTAINFNFGVMYKPTEQLYIGASYRHETKVDYDDGKVEFTGMAALSPFFPGGKGKTSITLPRNIFVGVAYAFTPSLTLEADFQSIGWSSYDELKVEIENGPSAPAALGGQPLQRSPAPAKKNWNDAWMARLGAEYSIDPLAIRAGFIYDKTPQPEAKVEPMLPDANRVEFTAGLGFKLLPWLGVDVAYQIILFEDRKVSPQVNPFPGTYENQANLFGLNLTAAL